jgi:hypothetical protein
LNQNEQELTAVVKSQDTNHQPEGSQPFVGGALPVSGAPSVTAATQELGEFFLGI